MVDPIATQKLDTIFIASKALRCTISDLIKELEPAIIEYGPRENLEDDLVTIGFNTIAVCQKLGEKLDSLEYVIEKIQGQKNV